MGRNLLTVSALLLLAACATAPKRVETASTPVPAAQPATLAFPYLIEAEAQIEGYREAALKIAPSYVTVEILAPANPARGEPGGLVHRASGVVVAPGGLIVTAAHIARSTAMEARIVAWDGTTHAAEILDVAPERELALLRAAGSAGLVPIAFADSDALAVRDPAVALGSPRRQRGVGSVGRVKRPKYDRRLQYGDWGFDDAIWLDMEVESGHSGGPVVDLEGRLIGMVAGYELGDTSKTPYVSPRITYAVPSNGVRRYLQAAGS